MTAELSPKPCGLLRPWGTVSLNVLWKMVAAMYLPVAQMGAVASPPRRSLFARSHRLPSSQRSTAPEPPCSVITDGRYQSHLARSSTCQSALQLPTGATRVGICRWDARRSKAPGTQLRIHPRGKSWISWPMPTFLFERRSPRCPTSSILKT